MGMRLEVRYKSTTGEVILSYEDLICPAIFSDTKIYPLHRTISCLE